VERCQNFAARPVPEDTALNDGDFFFIHDDAVRNKAGRTLYAKHRGPEHPDTLASMSNLARSYSALGRHAGPGNTASICSEGGD